MSFRGPQPSGSFVNIDFTPDDLNCRFLSITDKFAEALPLTFVSPVSFCSLASSVFHLSEVSESIVISIINGLESKKASGVDGIPVQFIKAEPSSIGSLVTRLVSFSIKSGIFPIKKTKESTELTYFHPISVLPVLSKVLEHVVYDQLIFYLLQHNLLYEWQSGFCPHYSSQDALLHITDSWRRAIDDSKFTAAAFFNVSKAFNCVNHDVLLSKLTCHGVLEHSIVSFASYLSCHKQRVCMQGLSSMKGEIHVGVPQGSILGPLLFSIYMNDLPNVVQICELNLYADDMEMHCSDANLASTERDLQQDIQSVNSWLCVNLLTLNIRKSNVMLIGSHQELRNDLSITVDGKQFSCV